MMAFNRNGFVKTAPIERPRPSFERRKSKLELVEDKIEALTQAKEGHEARIEYLELVISALCEATGVVVPEPSNLYGEVNGDDS